MGSKRQIVLMSALEGEPDGGMPPLGTLSDVSEAMGRFNTAQDGGPRSGSTGTAVLHGPGYMVEVATGLDRITQAMVTITDDEYAVPVLVRMCMANRWKMVDMETGQSFG